MLLKEKIIEFWWFYKNPILNNILVNLDKAEEPIYSSTSEEYDSKIESVFEAYNDAKYTEESAMILAKFCQHLSLIYLAYFMQQLHKNNKIFFDDFLSYLNENEEFKAIYTRNILFERLQIIARIFSENRLETIFEALDTVM